MADSVDTRVRVLRLLNTMLTVRPDRDPESFCEMDPDLMARLCVAALRTRVENSVGVRSAIERRCRGAKGEIGGVVGLCWEYCRTVMVTGLGWLRHANWASVLRPLRPDSWPDSLSAGIIVEGERNKKIVGERRQIMSQLKMEKSGGKESHRSPQSGLLI